MGVENNMRDDDPRGRREREREREEREKEREKERDRERQRDRARIADLEEQIRTQGAMLESAAASGKQQRQYSSREKLLRDNAHEAEAAAELAHMHQRPLYSIAPVRSPYGGALTF